MPYNFEGPLKVCLGAVAFEMGRIDFQKFLKTTFTRRDPSLFRIAEPNKMDVFNTVVCQSTAENILRKPLSPGHREFPNINQCRHFRCLKRRDEVFQQRLFVTDGGQYGHGIFLSQNNTRCVVNSR